MFQQSVRTPNAFILTGALAVSMVLSGCSLAPLKDSRENISVFPKPTHWQAFSRTALAITGDISLTDTQLTFSNQASINLEPLEHDASANQTLFKVTSKANPELLNGNLFCGQQPVDYLVVQVSGEVSGQSDMQLMAYYYPESLHLADLPLKDKDDLERMMCALYTYVSVPAKPAGK